VKTNSTAYDLLERVRRRKPVVHHLTNWVTIYDCAQVVKTLGGSPVMAHAKEELVDMTAIASAVVLNIGTLTVEFIDAMKLAAHSANTRVIPVVLDVCGAGATRLRDQKCLELLDGALIDVIKGNASEIARISGETIRTRGVDSGEVNGDVVAMAQKLAKQRDATVVVTGKEDIVTDGRNTWLVKNGHEIMTRVVGTGCMATSVIASFAAVEGDLNLAAVGALTCYGVAAELAMEKCSGPGTFKGAFFDCLYQLNRETVEKMQKVQSLEIANL
jgi:hydroxyethylthiazole kinase